MTETVAASTARPRRHHRRRSGWRTVVLAAPGDGSTRRRASDVVRVALALGAVVLTYIWVRTGPTVDLDLASDLTSVPNGLRWLTTAVWYLGSAGVIIGLAVIALASRRLTLARDTVVAGVGTWLFCLGLTAWLGTSGGRPPADTTSSTDFPLVEMAAAVAVACAVLPYLSRPARRLFGSLVVLGALAAVLRGTGLPLAVLASIVIGWGFAAAVHLVFGSPTGLPSAADVVDAADDLDVELSAVEPVRPQVWGVARFTAQLVDGPDGDRPVTPGPVDVSVYGRDAGDAQLLAKAWRFLWYRDSGPTLALSRLQQVEHEAYLTMAAAEAGVRAPAVVRAGVAPDTHEAVLLTRPPDGRPLGDLDAGEVGDDVLDALFRSLTALRTAGIAHGSISGETVLVGADGAVGLRDFRAASASAPTDRLDRDLAGGLVTGAAVVGVEPAVAAARRVLGADLLTGALAHLQPAALDRVTRATAHHHKKLLSDLRTAGAEAAGADPPALADIHRVSWSSAAMGFGAVLGVYLIVQEFAGVDDLWGTLQTAQWPWVILAFVLAQSTNVSQAWSVIGSVASPLPFGPTLELELANAFTGLVAGTVGTTATIIRFFQRRGLAVSVAVSSGVLVSVATMITQTILFLVAFLISHGDFTFSTSSSSSSDGGDSNTGTLLLILLVVVAAAIGAITAVPRLRHQALAKLKPQVQAARDNLRDLAASPGKLVRLFGGATLSQVLFALTLGASLHAYGASASLAELLVINTLASLLGGIAPVPGGMGVIEAGLIAGFTAIGIPTDIAVAATLTSRLFTAYLPPIWGYPTLVWMRKREYL